jgi:hypothetical protein
MLKERGFDIVSRLNKAHRKADFRKGKRLGPDDHIVCWQKPTSIRSVDRKAYHSLPDHVIICEARIRIEQPDFRTKSMVVVAELAEGNRLATLAKLGSNKFPLVDIRKSTPEANDHRAESRRLRTSTQPRRLCRAETFTVRHTMNYSSCDLSLGISQFFLSRFHFRHASLRAVRHPTANPFQIRAMNRGLKNSSDVRHRKKISSILRFAAT